MHNFLSFTTSEIQSAFNPNLSNWSAERKKSDQLLSMIWCQAQPKLKLQLQLQIELVITSLNPATRPTHVTNMKDAEQSRTQKTKVICLYKQTLKACFDHATPPKMAPLGPKSFLFIWLCVKGIGSKFSQTRPIEPSSYCLIQFLNRLEQQACSYFYQ